MDVDKSVYIAPNAYIVGKVKIGKDSSVWPMAVIRGDVNTITIGERTSIQDGCVLHVTHDGPYTPGGSPLKIGNDVTVGHSVNLHACTVEDECIVGIGSIVLDGAILQRGMVLAAGSVVPPGKILDSGYLWMGSPAKKMRALTEKEKENLLYSAQHYVRLKNTYIT